MRSSASMPPQRRLGLERGVCDMLLGVRAAAQFAETWLCVRDTRMDANA